MWCFRHLQIFHVDIYDGYQLYWATLKLPDSIAQCKRRGILWKEIQVLSNSYNLGFILLLLFEIMACTRKQQLCCWVQHVQHFVLHSWCYWVHLSKAKRKKTFHKGKLEVPSQTHHFLPCTISLSHWDNSLPQPLYRLSKIPAVTLKSQPPVLGSLVCVILRQLIVLFVLFAIPK